MYFKFGFDRYTGMKQTQKSLGRIMARIRSCWLAAGIVFAAVLSNPLTSPGAESGLIKVVLPVPPGGAGDLIARLLTDQVGRLNNRSFVIETRPGAGTMIGTEAVARAPADGKTLLINAPFLLIAPHLRKLSFDP